MLHALQFTVEKRGRCRCSCLEATPAVPGLARGGRPRPLAAGRQLGASETAGGGRQEPGHVEWGAENKLGEHLALLYSSA